MTTINHIPLKQIIVDILKEHSTLDYKDGRFKADVHVNYDDRLSDENVRQISEADAKKEAFIDSLSEYSREATDQTEDDILTIIEKHWQLDQYLTYDDAFHDILEEVGEIVDYEFPNDHFLKQEVLVNFIIDAGDGNYDYTLNNFLSYNGDPKEKIEDESSLLWLMKQQGYKKSDLNRLVRKGETQDSNFLSSLHTEARNVTTHMNALAFFVKMPLGDYIEFGDSGKSITFSKETACGLYDPWNGAGGPLGIELEKDVAVPAKIVRPHIENTYGYGVDSIYGMLNSFWKDTVLSIKKS